MCVCVCDGCRLPLVPLRGLPLRRQCQSEELDEIVENMITTAFFFQERARLTCVALPRILPLCGGGGALSPATVEQHCRGCSPLRWPLWSPL